MKTKVLSLIALGLLGAVTLTGCGKGTSGSTKIIKGPGGASSPSSVLKGSLIEPKMVQSQTPILGKNNQIQNANAPKCWSLAELTADLKSKEIADAMVVVSSYDLNIGNSVTDPSQLNLNKFTPLEHNDLNDDIRANLFLQLQPTKWSLEPIFSTMTVSELMSSTDPELQKLASVLTITAQADCTNIRPADGVSVPLLIKTPTEIAFTDNDKITRDYMISSTSIVVTLYTDVNTVATAQGKLSLCGKTDNYKVKQSYLISYREGAKQLTASPALIQLLQKNGGSKDFKAIKTTTDTGATKDLKTAADFSKNLMNTPIPVTPLLLQNAINTIRSGKGFTVNTCPAK